MISLFSNTRNKQETYSPIKIEVVTIQGNYSCLEEDWHNYESAYLCAINTSKFDSVDSVTLSGGVLFKPIVIMNGEIVE